MIFQIEWLYLTYGIMFGGGSSLTYTPSLVILGHYFKRHMGMVNGFVTTGSSIFTLAMPHILEGLLSSCGVSQGRLKRWTSQLDLGNTTGGLETVVSVHTAKRKLERLQFSTSSSFVKIWSACSCDFKAYFWTFWALYHLLFYLETIGVN